MLSGVCAVPVEGPLEQELASCLGETGASLVWLQDLVDDIVQPGCPLVQRALLLQGHLEVLLQPLDHPLLALTHPGCLLLHSTRSKSTTVKHMTMFSWIHSPLLAPLPNVK